MNVVSIIKYFTLTKNSYLVQMFGLWSSHSWSTITCPKKAIADPLPKYCCSFLLCNINKSSKEDASDPTLVLSTMATRSDYFVVGWGTVNNSKNT